MNIFFEEETEYDDEFTFNYISVINNFKEHIVDANIKPGTLLIVKNSFHTWMDNPVSYRDFNCGDSLVVLKIIEIDDTIELKCLYKNDYVIICPLMFILNDCKEDNFAEIFKYFFRTYNR